MIAAISLFIVVFLSVLITRIATIALSHTGLSRESARFQARSALTGAGFTTSESEQVVNHPVRRKVILLLMLIGNAGLVTAISTLMLTFIKPSSTQSMLVSVVILVVSLSSLWAAAKSEWVDQYLSRGIDKALKKFTNVDTRDYDALLHLSGDYQITEMMVEPDDWIADKSLGNIDLSSEGVIVLGIKRQKGNYIGTPDGSTEIKPNDMLTLYGKASLFNEMDRRKKGYKGDLQHVYATNKQKKSEKKEKQKDEEE